MYKNPSKSRFHVAFSSKRRSRKRGSHTALWEACCIAVDSIWTHKLRTFLTLLGIIIGIASVVTVGGAIEGLGFWVSDSMSSFFASNTFTVSRFNRMNVSSEDFETIIKRNKDIYPEDMQAVEDKCRGCVAISPMIRRTDDVKRGSKIVYDANVSGVSMLSWAAIALPLSVLMFGMEQWGTSLKTPISTYPIRLT
jgi:hypothetical protein